MVRSVSHHGHIHFPHLHQRMQESGETGHLGRRTIRRIHDRIHNAFHHSNPVHSGGQNNPQKIQERSVKAENNQRTNEVQKKSEPRPLPPKLRRGPLYPTQLSNGSGITVSAPGLTEETKSDLEKKYNISITPVRVNGKEIGYVFGSHTSRDVGQIFLECHGDGRNVGNFEKPVGVGLKFVAPDNCYLVANPSQLIEKIAEGNVVYTYPYRQFYDSESKRTIKNYKLFGFSESTKSYVEDPRELAEYINKLKSEGKPINVMRLNPNAYGVYLKDVIQGVNDTFRRMPELILAHCRQENSYAMSVEPFYRHWATGEERDPKFAPRLEKHKAGDWTHELSKHMEKSS